MLEPLAPIFHTVTFHRLESQRWKMLWPTHRQATILADRSVPKPRTRGEAAELIQQIAKEEGWGR